MSQPPLEFPRGSNGTNCATIMGQLCQSARQKPDRRQTTGACAIAGNFAVEQCLKPRLGAEGKRIRPMTEKRRRDEPQSGPLNGGPASNLNRALKSIVTVQSSNSRGRLHRRDARRAALGQRRRHPRQRACADDRLSDHGGRERLARRRRRPGHPGSRACRRCGDRLRPCPGSGRAQLPGARARPLERGQARRPGDGRGRRRGRSQCEL